MQTQQLKLSWNIVVLSFRLEKVYNLLKEHSTPKKQDAQSGKWNCAWIMLKHLHLFIHPSIFLSEVLECLSGFKCGGDLFNVFSFLLFALEYIRQILVCTNVTEAGVTPATVASL